MKIAIVSALSTTGDALRRAVSATPHEVIWSAADAALAIEASARRMPDLLLLDLALPGSAEAARLLVTHTHCAVLVVSDDVGANATRVFNAMGNGAIDAVDTPPLDAANWRIAVVPFVAKLNSVSKRIVKQRRREIDVRQRAPPNQRRLLAIGASAGGPAALAELLGALPTGFPVAIAIVQHVDQQFAPGMADWLNGFSRVPVRVATEGDRLEAGIALLASSNDHLVLKSADRVGYTAHPRAQVYRPSVDVFFHSVEAHWPGNTVGVLLTGMGRDGAQGLKALRDKGCYTIAQDQATSAVYGMPQAAAKAGAAVDILPLGAIAARLIEYFSAAT